MNEVSPCKGCLDRSTACHGSCEQYQEWRDRVHAQKKHLEDNKYRWNIPMTSAREKAYANYRPDNRKFTQGGNNEQ